MPKQKDIELFSYIGLRIKTKRRELKISKEKIAEFLDVNNTQIFKYESGESKIPIDKLIKLAKLFNVSIEWFLGDFYKFENLELDNKILKLKEIYNSNNSQIITIVYNFIDSVHKVLLKNVPNK